MRLLASTTAPPLQIPLSTFEHPSGARACIIAKMHGVPDPSARSILLLDDDPDVGIAAQLLLQRRVAPVHCLRRPSELIAALDRLRPSLLLLDLNFGPGRSDGVPGPAPTRRSPGATGLTARRGADGVRRYRPRGARIEARRLRFHREALGQRAPRRHLPGSSAARPLPAGRTDALLRPPQTRRRNRSRHRSVPRYSQPWLTPTETSVRPRVRSDSRARRCIGGWKSMASEKTRLILAALLWLAAGALAASADSSARMWVGAGVLLFVAIVVSWPLARTRAPAVARAEPAPAHDARRLAMLQSQLEHLPVAAWLRSDSTALQPLSSRARRLAAPGGVRDPAALNQMLTASDRNGPVLLDTERGTERWQLQRQTLAIDGQEQALSCWSRSSRSSSRNRCTRGSNYCRC